MAAQRGGAFPPDEVNKPLAPANPPPNLPRHTKTSDFPRQTPRSSDWTHLPPSHGVAWLQDSPIRSRLVHWPAPLAKRSTPERPYSARAGPPVLPNDPTMQLSRHNPQDSCPSVSAPASEEHSCPQNPEPLTTLGSTPQPTGREDPKPPPSSKRFVTSPLVQCRAKAVSLDGQRPYTCAPGVVDLAPPTGTSRQRQPTRPTSPSRGERSALSFESGEPADENAIPTPRQMDTERVSEVHDRVTNARVL